MSPAVPVEWEEAESPTDRGLANDGLDGRAAGRAIAEEDADSASAIPVYPPALGDGS